MHKTNNNWNCKKISVSIILATFHYVLHTIPHVYQIPASLFCLFQSNPAQSIKDVSYRTMVPLPNKIHSLYIFMATLSKSHFLRLMEGAEKVAEIAC
jgi:hypothetical protein